MLATSCISTKTMGLPSRFFMVNSTVGLLGTVVIASLVTLWIAASNPDGLVVDESEYQEIRRGLRAQESGQGPAEEDADPDDPGDGGD